MENQQSTKKEEYILRKKQKEEARLRQIRSRKIKKMAAIFLPLVLIVGGAAFGIVKISSRGDGGTPNQNGSPRMEISQEEYDAGKVSMAAGLVEKTFEIKNSGKGDLKIENIVTSCHCTTAVLKVGDKESPEFGMTNSNPFWSQRIAAGQTGYLEVIFDPAYHGSEGLGPVVRAVWFATNDSKNKKAEIRLLANVIH